MKQAYEQGKKDAEKKIFDYKYLVEQYHKLCEDYSHEEALEIIKENIKLNPESFRQKDVDTFFSYDKM